VKPISKRVFKLFVVDMSDCADQSVALSFQCHPANSCKKEFNCYNNMAFIQKIRKGEKYVKKTS
jgi:hypothetical protein